MPAHDWNLVDDGIFHGFHTVWIGALNNALNEGLLPEGYYALPEQHFGRPIADVLTLHSSPAPVTQPFPLPPDTGGTALAETPPRVRHRQTIPPGALARRRTLAIRHVSGHRLIALLEIVSPANKDRAEHVVDLATKVVDALDLGVHVLIVDLFPPGTHDPSGLHGAILERLQQSQQPFSMPDDEPLALVSYAARPQVEVFLEQIAVGFPLPVMPLFLRPDRYIDVPLEATYMSAYRGMPAFWRDVLEGRNSAAP
jgi:hypothetical protein